MILHHHLHLHQQTNQHQRLLKILHLHLLCFLLQIQRHYVPTRPLMNWAYSGEFLAFNVQMAYHADLKFDASQSNFNVTTIEAYSPTNQILGQDTDHDEKIILENHPSGD
eukprot:231650_1